MKQVYGTLINRIRRTPSVESFRFILKEKVAFMPGQFLQVMFNPEHVHDTAMNKYLSISSSPYKEYIEITKRVSASGFSQRLTSLKIHEQVLFRLPFGSCAYKDEYNKIAFLIGGIGITPVISIFDYIIDKRLSTDACLIYSNRTEEEIAFNKELNYWQSINRRLRVLYTVTDCQPQDQSCRFGYINDDLVKQEVSDIAERMVFIFGPPAMVDAMKKVCAQVGCKPENIKSENFTGY